jgi:hypothetical protein
MENIPLIKTMSDTDDPFEEHFLIMEEEQKVPLHENEDKDGNSEIEISLIQD